MPDDLIARESTREDWDGPVIDLVEDGAVVGCVYTDEGELLAEFYSDEDADPWVFDVTELQKVLDVAVRMLEPEGERPPAAAEAEDAGIDPIDQLASEFDATATRRGEEDEGFYPIGAARHLVGRCDQLDLAVVQVEGFRARAGELETISGYSTDFGKAHRGEPWPLYRAGCNTQAAATLEHWGRQDEILVALEVEDRNGEVYVL
jgi:hypothetical protein